MNFGNVGGGSVGDNAWSWPPLPSHPPPAYPAVQSNSSYNWNQAKYYGYTDLVQPYGNSLERPRLPASTLAPGPELFNNSVVTANEPFSDPYRSSYSSQGREHWPFLSSSDALASGSAFDYAGEFGSRYPMYPVPRISFDWENRPWGVDTLGYGNQPRKEGVDGASSSNQGNVGASPYPNQLNLESYPESWKKYNEETAFKYQGLDDYSNHEFHAGKLPAKTQSYPEQHSSFFSYGENETSAAAPGLSHHHEFYSAAVAGEIPNNLSSFQSSQGLPKKSDYSTDSSFPGLCPTKWPSLMDASTDPNLRQGFTSQIPDASRFISVHANEAEHPLYRSLVGCPSNANKIDSSVLDRSVGFFDKVPHEVSIRGSVEKVLDSPASQKIIKQPNPDVKKGAQAAIRKMLELSELLTTHSSIGYSLDEMDVKSLEVIKQNFNLCMATNFHQKMKKPGPSNPVVDASEKLEKLSSTEEATSSHSNTVYKTTNVSIHPDSQHKDQKKDDICNFSVKKGERLLNTSPCVDDLNKAINHEMVKLQESKIILGKLQSVEEMSPQAHLFKKLWLDAEAKLYSVGYEARINKQKDDGGRLDKLQDQMKAIELNWKENEVVYKDGSAVNPKPTSSRNCSHESISATDGGGEPKSTSKKDCSVNSEENIYGANTQHITFLENEEDDDYDEDEDDDEEGEEEEEETSDEGGESGCESVSELNDGSEMQSSKNTSGISDEEWEHISRDDNEEEALVQ